MRAPGRGCSSRGRGGARGATNTGSASPAANSGSLCGASSPSRDAAVELLEMAFGDPRVRLVGFAFASDLRRLAALNPSLAAPANPVRDIQTEALRRLGARHGWGGQTPSLKRCVASLLEEELDKSEQCSEWGVRPLRDAQVAYAALDAAVLIRLAHELDELDEGGD